MTAMVAAGLCAGEIAWRLQGNVQALEGEADAFVLGDADARLECPFANVEKLGVFEFSYENCGGSGRADVVFTNFEGEECGSMALLCPASSEWRANLLEIPAPEMAFRGTMTFRTTAQEAMKLRKVSIRKIKDFVITKPADDLGKVVIPQGTSDFPQARLVQENGLTSIAVDGRIIPPNQVWFWQRSTESQTRNAADAQLQILCVDVGNMGMTADGWDYSWADAMLAKHLQDYPDAYIVCFSFIAWKEFAFLRKAHPELLCQSATGNSNVGYLGELGEYTSLCSQTIREIYGDNIRRFIRHLRETPFASRVIGFQISDGISCEWMHWGAQSKEFTDYSQEAVADFRKWLTEKYGTDQALQKAWADDTVTLETAAVPTPEERGNPANGFYFLPQTEMNVLDYTDYMSDVIAYDLNYYGKIIKEETGNRSLNGAFFGYTCYFMEDSFLAHTAGHFALRKVYDAPYVDYFLAPCAYWKRRMGEPLMSMSCPWAATANGKLFYNHVDFRQHWGKDYYASPDMTDAVSVMYREISRSLAEGNAIEWYDFSNGWTFEDKRLTKYVRKCSELYQRYRGVVKDFPVESYLLFVVDDQVAGRTAPEKFLYGRAPVFEQVTLLAQAGIPWRAVLFSDLMKHPELLKYRAFLFANPTRLDAEQLAFIREKVMTDGRFVGFVGPVGLLSPEGLTTAAAEELLGQKFTLVEEPMAMSGIYTEKWAEFAGHRQVLLSHADDESGTRLDGDYPEEKWPFTLVPQDVDAENVVATFTDGGKTAIFYKETPSCKLYWSGIAGHTPKQLQKLARLAGLPVVCDSEDALFIGCGYMGIHAASDGVKKLKLIGEGTPRDLFSGKVWPKGTKEITLEMKRGDNYLIIME